MELAYELIEDDTLKIEITPKVADRVGDYILEVSYELVNMSNADGNEEYKIDTNAFTIVPRTYQMSDDITEIPATSVVTLGFKGDKGDSAFTVWNEENGGKKTYQEWIDFLHSPATEAKDNYFNVIQPQLNDKMDAIDATIANVIDVVIPDAEVATQNAQDVSDDYHTTVKPTIIEQGNITQAQGNIAQQQGIATKIIGEELDDRIIELELHKNPIVVLTEDEYDELIDKDPDTYYFISEE